MFDTLELFNKLRKTGLSEQQAEAYVETMAEIFCGEVEKNPFSHTEKYTHKLCEAGYTQQQAEVIMEGIEQANQGKFASAEKVRKTFAKYGVAIG